MTTTATRPQNEAYTVLLQRWRSGDEAARRALFDRLYADLHRMAERRMAFERAGHTLAPTSLVHEVFLRLEGARVDCADQREFLALAATVMRRILVDSARRRQSARRHTAKQTQPPRPFDGEAAVADEAYVIALDRALHRLGSHDAKLLKVVELRFFLGLSIEEVAQRLEVSTPTVKRRWRTARAFLQREIERDERA